MTNAKHTNHKSHTRGQECANCGAQRGTKQRADACPDKIDPSVSVLPRAEYP